MKTVDRDDVYMCVHEGSTEQPGAGLWHHFEEVDEDTDQGKDCVFRLSCVTI